MCRCGLFKHHTSRGWQEASSCYAMIFLLASSSKIRFPMRRVFIRSELLAEAEADRLLDLFARVSSFWYVELSARSERVSTSEKCPSLREYQKSYEELQILRSFSAIRVGKAKPLEDLSGPHWHDHCHDHRLSLMTRFHFDHLFC